MNEPSDGLHYAVLAAAIFLAAVIFYYGAQRGIFRGLSPRRAARAAALAPKAQAPVQPAPTLPSFIPPLEAPQGSRRPRRRAADVPPPLTPAPK